MKSTILSMKSTILSLSVLLFLIISCTSKIVKKDKEFVLNGEINGQDSGQIFLQYMHDSIWQTDTTEIKKGKFVFEGKISEPSKARLRAGDDPNRVEIYIESGVMKITLQKDKFAECKMTGSKAQDDLVLLKKMVEPIYSMLEMQKKQMSNLQDSIKNSNNEHRRLQLEKKVEEIDQQWSITRESLNSTWLKFILENPKSYVAPDYLYMLEANEEILLDSLKSIFNGLDNSIQKCRIGKIISDDIRRKENIRIGAQATEFKATDLNQQVITLSKFKGKSVVLLDFWASWCIPCRAGFPHLKNLYKRYHHQGFEVIAVSTDWKRDAWITAVKQDSTEMWYHVPVAEKYAAGPSQWTKDDIIKNYFVQAIPVQLLIDKEGKIVGRWLGKSQENEEALDIKLKEIFNN